MTSRTSKPNADFMRAAIKDAKCHCLNGVGGPFGACIVKNGKIITLGHNSVLADLDPTAHAEVNAIRSAAKILGSYDLSGCVIYSTTEPCPMCFSAIHWAKIDEIVYGTNIADVQRLGFNELEISNQHMKAEGKSPVTIIADFLRDECLTLLDDWKSQSKPITY